MPDLFFQLFGKFSARDDAQPLKGLDAGKDQELLSFLLIRGQQHHSREALAAMLWGDTSTERSKKYLRQSLWHLQHVLETSVSEPANHLLIEHDWLRLNPTNRPWCDVEEFEKAATAAEGISGRRLTDTQAGQLKAAAVLYRDDLLVGWYQEWVLFERERLQNKYLLLLDKLIVYSETHQEYEQGQGYATRILRYDPARERTHRELMRLYYLSGDRTAALRQYERCVIALQRELSVIPERRTIDLYEQMKSGRYRRPEAVAEPEAAGDERPESRDLLDCLKHIHRMLNSVQRRIQHDIRSIEHLPRTERKKL
ncbi:MAG TPA: BTAD domain-containing putative transcriptional regulator [Pyrinomonadaceae bacterium]|nr:BTAD domain-containing putative transcriptional regulator [Pyrinomonadaceae bacterium]